MAVDGIDGRRRGKREEGKDPSSKHRMYVGWVWKMNPPTRDGKAKSVRRDDVISHAQRGAEKNIFSCSADHKQD